MAFKGNVIKHLDLEGERSLDKNNYCQAWQDYKEMEKKYGSGFESLECPWYNPDWPERCGECKYSPKENGHKKE